MLTVRGVNRGRWCSVKSWKTAVLIGDGLALLCRDG